MRSPGIAVFGELAENSDRRIPSSVPNELSRPPAPLSSPFSALATAAAGRARCHVDPRNHLRRKGLRARAALAELAGMSLAIRRAVPHGPLAGGSHGRPSPGPRCMRRFASRGSRRISSRPVSAQHVRWWFDEASGHAFEPSVPGLADQGPHRAVVRTPLASGPHACRRFIRDRPGASGASVVAEKSAAVGVGRWPGAWSGGHRGCTPPTSSS